MEIRELVWTDLSSTGLERFSIKNFLIKGKVKVCVFM